jgi:hypothetical protein
MTGYRRIAGPDEIGVQAVAEPLRDRAIRRHQRLRDDMAAEDARAGFPAAADAPEEIDLELFDIQQVQQFLGRAS